MYQTKQEEIAACAYIFQ